MPPASRKPVIRDSEETLCRHCRGTIPGGEAHVVLHAGGNNRHALYHPNCCPDQHITTGLSRRLLADT